MKQKTRIIAILLLCALLVSVLPAQAFAAPYPKSTMDALVEAWNKSKYAANQDESYQGAYQCLAFVRYTFVQLYGHTDKGTDSNNTVKSYTCGTSDQLLNSLLTYAAPGDAFRLTTSKNTHIMHLYDITDENEIKVYQSNYTDASEITNKAEARTFASVTKMMTSLRTLGVTVDNGKFSREVTLQIIHAKENTKTSADFSCGSNTYTINYDANGGEGTMAPLTVKENGTFTISRSAFSRAGYEQTGWYLRRDADNKYYVAGQGWFTEAEISANGFHKNLYVAERELTLGGSWTNGYDGVSSYTFLAVWEPTESPTEPTEAPTEPSEAVIPGDVDGSGEVDTIDSIRMAKYLVDLVELTAEQKQAADLDGDGDITTIDAIRLGKYLVGMIESLK